MRTLRHGSPRHLTYRRRTDGPGQDVGILVQMSMIDRNGRPARRARRARVCFAAAELLEPRRLFAAVSWDGGGDGVHWTSAANWSTDALPTAADDVTISITGSPTVILDSGAQSINSLV